MYVSVPKNYGGVAFSQAKAKPSPPPAPSDEKEEKCEMPKELPPSPDCQGCTREEGKNPLSCLLSAFRGRERNGFDGEDFLLLGLIALLIGKEGNEDILLILAMLLLT